MLFPYLRQLAPAGALVLLSLGAGGANAATIAVIPDQQSYLVGSPVTVEVAVANVSDLYGFQFDLDFNPAVLQADTSSEGPFLATAGTTFFVPGANDNIAGTVLATADSLIGAIPGATGSGVLALFSFTAVSPGATDISLGNVQLLDSNLNALDVTPVDASITVAPVPVPGSLLLLTSAVGLLGFALFRNPSVPNSNA